VGRTPAAAPSFFQSSMPSKPDDRATTLKKIDEIEAQMSMQWWKTKNGGIPDSTPPHASPNSGVRNPSVHAPLLDNALPTAYRATAPAGLQSAGLKQADAVPPRDAPSTEPDSLSIALAEARGGGLGAKPPPPAPVGLPGGLAGIGRDEGGSSGFSHPNSAPSTWPKALSMTPNSKRPPSALPMATMPARKPACWKSLLPTARAPAMRIPG
jgi:hypothetical protein